MIKLVVQNFFVVAVLHWMYNVYLYIYTICFRCRQMVRIDIKCVCGFFFVVVFVVGINKQDVFSIHNYAGICGDYFVKFVDFYFLLLSIIIDHEMCITIIINPHLSSGHNYSDMGRNDYLAKIF